MKEKEEWQWEEQAHLKKNHVEMKNRDNLIKNSVAGLNSSLDTAQERVSELEDWSDKSPEHCTEQKGPGKYGDSS